MKTLWPYLQLEIKGGPTGHTFTPSSPPTHPVPPPRVRGPWASCPNGGYNGGVGDYATIHITPEPEFSYISFETNIATENYMDLVIKVVDTFKPNKLIVTFYATRVKTDEEF